MKALFWVLTPEIGDPDDWIVIFMAHERAVLLKLSTFLTFQPEVYFAQGEAQFQLGACTKNDRSISTFSQPSTKQHQHVSWTWSLILHTTYTRNAESPTNRLFRHQQTGTKFAFLKFPSPQGFQTSRFHIRSISSPGWKHFLPAVQAPLLETALRKLRYPGGGLRILKLPSFGDTRLRSLVKQGYGFKR